MICLNIDDFLFNHKKKVRNCTKSPYIYCRVKLYAFIFLAWKRIFSRSVGGKQKVFVDSRIIPKRRLIDSYKIVRFLRISKKLPLTRLTETFRTWKSMAIIFRLLAQTDPSVTLSPTQFVYLLNFSMTLSTLNIYLSNDSFLFPTLLDSLSATSSLHCTISFRFP